jgi:MFS family permease
LVQEISLSLTARWRVPMFRNAYARYVLAILTLVNTLNYLDRGLVGLLVQPIKEDLHLSDTQLGFLTGLAFALFYATLGLPIARWADRGNRTTITSIAIGLWGITVMLCLLVTSYIQLVLARIAAAVGESGSMPPTYSLLGDYFPGAAQRTRAVAIYMLAGPMATLISFILGGHLNEHYGWRMTFFIMGIPAVLVALLFKLTVKEPRSQLGHASTSERRLPRLAEVMRTLWSQRSCRHLGLGIILLFTMGLGLSPWYAAFMVRTQGMGIAELGIWLGLIFGLSGIVGVLSGGYLAGRWFAQDEGGQMRLNAVMITLLVPCSILFLLIPQRYPALMALMPLVAVFNFVLGPAFALLQRLVNDDIRATTLALVMLLANLVGMGLGPQIVGILSDSLFPVLGNDSLRYAMLIMSLVALWAAHHFWQAGRTVREDLATLACGLQPQLVTRQP